MDLVSSLIKMGASLLVVIGLIALTAYGARRFFGERLGAWRSRPAIHVLSRASLGARREVALLQVGEICLVVGVTSTQISMLAQVEPHTLVPDPVAPHQPVEAL